MFQQIFVLCIFKLLLSFYIYIYIYIYMLELHFLMMVQKWSKHVGDDIRGLLEKYPTFFFYANT